MRSQTGKAARSGKGWIAGCGLAAGIVLLAGLCAAVVLLARYDWRQGIALNATILTPLDGSQTPLNSEVVIEAGAVARRGVTRLEVYADGGLVLAENASQSGQTPLALAGLWRPESAGRHVLVARAYGTENDFVDSAVVYVDVLPPSDTVSINVDDLAAQPGSPSPSLSDLATLYGVTPEQLAQSNPGLSGTDPYAPLPPGTTVEAPASSSPPSPPSPPAPPPPPPPPPPGAPAPPTNLRVSADCTSATLTWNDSPDETGYRIYRLGPGDVRPLAIASPPANTTSFRDALPALPGGQVFRYQVASVRSGREGAPSLMAAATTPAGCVGAGAPPGSASDLMLTVAMVNTDAAWDGVYCYLSINDQPYERIPLGDSNLLSPDPSNRLYYNLARQPGGGRVNLNGHPVSNPVILRGECRGRRGPRTEQLGRFEVSHRQPEWDGSLRSTRAGSFRFSYCIGPAAVACTPVIPPEAPAALTPGGYLNVVDLTEVLLYLPPPHNLRFGASREACDQLSGPVARPACSLNMLFGGGRETALLWDWTPTPLVPESDLTAYTVYRTEVDLASGAMFTISWDISRGADGRLLRMTLPRDADLRCNKRVEYRVRARQGARQSRMSDPLTFTSLVCPSAARVNINFQTLQLDNVNDIGDPCIFCPARDTELEISAYFSAGGGSLPWSQRSLHADLEQGTYNLRSLRMGSCFGGDTPCITAAYGFNVFETVISDPSDEVVFGAWLADDDRNWLSGWAEDVFCNVSMRLVGRSIEDWSRINQTFTLRDTTTPSPQADCTITVRVSGAPITP